MTKQQCVPGVSCVCPPEYARCRKWAALEDRAAAGEPEAIAQLTAAQAKVKAKRRADEMRRLTYEQGQYLSGPIPKDHQ